MALEGTSKGRRGSPRLALGQERADRAAEPALLRALAVPSPGPRRRCLRRATQPSWLAARSRVHLQARDNLCGQEPRGPLSAPLPGAVADHALGGLVQLCHGSVAASRRSKRLRRARPLTNPLRAAELG